MSVNIAYFGTPAVSARFLEKLLNDSSLPVTISMVVTQPDKPVGRKQELTPSAVKAVATQHGIEVVHEPTAELLASKNIDVAVVFAYGRIIPQELLAATPHGMWNIHPSMLPHYRGASPVSYALMLGEDTTGCTLMLMDNQLDHGPIIAQRELAIDRADTHLGLLDKLADIGYELFAENVVCLADGKLEESKLAVQNDTIATLSRQLKREDGKIELDLIKKALAKENIVTDEFPKIMRDYLGQNSISEFPIPYAPYIVYNMFRGLTPWPGIWTEVSIGGATKRLKILEVSLEDNALHIHKVQLEGKAPVDFQQFNAAYNLF